MVNLTRSRWVCKLHNRPDLAGTVRRLRTALGEAQAEIDRLRVSATAPVEICITVAGGAVRGVLSDQPAVSVLLVDCDTQGADAAELARVDGRAAFLSSFAAEHAPGAIAAVGRAYEEHLAAASEAASDG